MVAKAISHASYSFLECREAKQRDLVGDRFSGPSDSLRTPTEQDRGPYSPNLLDVAFSET